MKQPSTSVIKFYQTLAHVKHSILISVFGYSSVCRHQPSCSQYAIDQIKEHGTILGFLKGCVRILTCWSV